MGQHVTKHPEYERGYHDGYQSGVNYALKGAIDVAMKSSQPSMVISAPNEVVVAAKRDLAVKVLQVINAQHTVMPGYYFCSGVDAALIAVKALFAAEGVAVEERR